MVDDEEGRVPTIALAMALDPHAQDAQADAVIEKRQRDRQPWVGPQRHPLHRHQRQREQEVQRQADGGQDR